MPKSKQDNFNFSLVRHVIGREKLTTPFHQSDRKLKPSATELSRASGPFACLYFELVLRPYDIFYLF